MENDNKKLEIQNQVIDHKEIEEFEKQKNSRDMLEAGKEALFKNLEKIREQQKKRENNLK